MAELTPVGDVINDNGKLESIPVVEPTKGNPNGVPTKGTLGGPRPGGGRPKGKLNQKTLDQIAVREAFQQRVMKHANELFEAQLSLAKGETVVMVVRKEKDEKGRTIRKFSEQVTDPYTIQQVVDWEENIGDDPSDDENFYYIQTRSPNNQALEALLNRALGKAADKIEVTGGFFNQPELTIKVVGSPHDDIDISDSGQVADSADVSGTDAERAPELGDQAS